MVKKLIGLILFLGVLVSEPSHAGESGFMLQATATKHTLRHYFPQADVKQADRINTVMLKPKLRPPSWTDRIPFGVAIDSTKNTAYYLLYESFFSKKIVPFPNMEFKKLADISANTDGQVALADVGGNQIQFFQFKYPHLSSTAFVKVTAPRRVEFDYQGRLWCLGQAGLSIFQPGKDNLEPMKAEAALINATLGSEVPIDLSINRQGNAVILAGQSLYQFLPDGTLSGTANIQAPYCAIETSAYGEIFCLRANEKKFDIYSSGLTYMLSVDVSEAFTEQPLDLTIYDNFGYVIINALHQGAYYGMGVAIAAPNFVSIGEAEDGYQIQFMLTMPAYLWITVNGQTLDQKRVVVENVLQRSGRQSVFWDGKIDGKPVKNATVVIRATAAYSLGNTAKSELKVSL